MPLIVRFENPLGKKLGNDYHYKHASDRSLFCEVASDNVEAL